MAGARVRGERDRWHGQGGSPPALGPGQTYASVTDHISSIVLAGTPRAWWIGFAIASLGMLVLLLSIGFLLLRGVGIWGIDIPVAWAFAITNFVWWIGIGHADTLISAILLLLRQRWRNSINRFAEAMTLFAVACAGLFPLLHLGRPFRFYWLVPYPNTMGLWPQFRSPLVWDFFAVATYGTVSLVFWYVGLMPDLATLRDRARRPFARLAYGVLSLGWRGSAGHWHRYETAYLILAGLATPLVVSVHSIVSLDFAVGIVPGWHSTIFPPYFVAGAIFSGFAMVLTLAIPLRAFYHLYDFITPRHLDFMARILLVMSLFVAYGYLMETFMGWYSGDRFEGFLIHNRALGPYGWLYWTLLACNVLAPQLFWFRRARADVRVLFAVALVVNVGMWVERFVIVVVSLHRDFLPAAWGFFKPTVWDWSTLAGSLALFAFLFFLFIRVLPSISIFEVRELVAERGGRT